MNSASLDFAPDASPDKAPPATMKLLIDFSHHPVLCRLQGLGHLRRHGWRLRPPWCKSPTCGPYGKVEPMQWLSLAIVLFGGATLLAHSRNLHQVSPPCSIG